MERSVSSRVKEGLEFDLRPASVLDAPVMAQLSTGPIAGKLPFIAESFDRRHVVGAFDGMDVVGYIVWDRTFFGRPFVWLLGVDRAFRRRGLAARLMEEFERACPGEPLFTSTNSSNAPMHALVARLGYVRSGWVENLDPGDPEIFYFKKRAQV